MLQKMRDRSQSAATKILLGLLIVVFTMFGFGAFEAFLKADPPVAEVDGVKITRGQLAVETDRQRQRILAEMGDSANPDLIDPARLEKSVLDGLVNQAVLVQSAQRMGMRVSAGEVDRVILDNPQFQVDGKFDADHYRSVLANVGYTPLAFKAEMANNFTVSQLTGAVRETALATDAQMRSMARLLAQKRDVAYLLFTPDKFAGQITVGDADVDAYYQAHLPDFVTQDTVDVDFVELSVAELAKDPALAPTDEQVSAQYEADAKAFKPTERRQIAHILLQINDARSEAAATEQLSAIKARIARGEAFDAIARSVSEDPGSAAGGGDLGLVSKGALVPEFEQAAWALGVNEVSAPVRTQFGVHLIKVLAIPEDRYGTLAELAPQINTRLREQAAEEKFRTRMRELDELAFETPDDLVHVSEASGLPIRHVTGVTVKEGPAPFDSAVLRSAAFGDEVLAKGFNSKVTEVDKRAYVLRVGAHRPPEQRALGDVAAEIRAKLVQEAAAERARTAAAEALARVIGGEGATTIAAAYGLEWQRVDRATRAVANVDREIVNAAFNLPRPTTDRRSATSTDLQGGRVAVVSVSAVVDGDYGEFTETDREAMRTQLNRRIGNDEFDALFLTLRDSASVKRP